MQTHYVVYTFSSFFSDERHHVATRWRHSEGIHCMYDTAYSTSIMIDVGSFLFFIQKLRLLFLINCLKILLVFE